VKIAAINQGHVGRRPAQCFDGVEASKTAAQDYDAMHSY
jgi:hypothetical protein